MEGRCKNCWFWAPGGFPVYLHDRRRDEWGDCSLLGDAQSKPTHSPPPLAGATADEWAGFVTAPDFGCVQFEHGTECVHGELLEGTCNACSDAAAAGGTPNPRGRA